MVTYKIFTDKGGRDVNEDSAIMAEKNGNYVFILADGLGGHGKGEVASGLVTEIGKELFLNYDDASYIESCFETAQMELLEEQKRQNAQSQMKTTMVVLELKDGQARWGHGVEKNKTIIKLYISSGIDDIDETKDTTVPKLIGMDYNTASQTAGVAKLYIYRSGSEYSSTVPKGQIMRQDVAEGTTVKEGTRIGVVVSLGEQMARVPDVQYKDVNEAINLLTSNNLSYDVQYEDSDTVAKAHVIRQSVAAGTEVAMQTKVTVYISKGNPNANKQAVIVAENTTAASTSQSITESCR